MPEKKTTKKTVVVKKRFQRKKEVKKAPAVVPQVEAVGQEQPESIPEIIIPEEAKRSNRFFEAVGRRKTAVARIRLFTQGEKEILVNKKPYKVYFTTPETQLIADSALSKMKCQDKFRVLAEVKGGGFHAQSEAVRHGIARALVAFNADFRKRLRRVGYLTRDPRKRERKKFGLKRARRAPQWNKR